MIIALRGAKRSGKSTAAKQLLAMCRTPIQVIGFAAPIKEFCGHVYGFSEAALYGASEEREKPIAFADGDRLAAHNRARSRITIQLEIWGRILGRDLSHCLPAFWDWMAQISRESSSTDQITPRRVLQTFGTEFGREVLGASFWIDLALEKGRRFSDLHPVKLARTVIEDCRFDNETIAVQQSGQGNLVIEIVNAEEITLPSTDTHASEQPCKVPPDFRIYNHPSRGLESLRQDLRRVTYL